MNDDDRARLADVERRLLIIEHTLRERGMGGALDIAGFRLDNFPAVDPPVTIRGAYGIARGGPGGDVLPAPSGHPGDDGLFREFATPQPWPPVLHAGSVLIGYAAEDIKPGDPVAFGPDGILHKVKPATTETPPSSPELR